MLRRVLEWRRRTLGDDHPQTRAVMSNYADALRATGRIDAAEPFARLALESARRALGDDHPDTARFKSKYAELITATGSHEPNPRTTTAPAAPTAAATTQPKSR
jgi:hypothetical protein